MFLVIWCNCINSQAQKSTLKGKVTDAVTGEAIPYSNVFTKPGYVGTYSNEDGEFILEVQGFPVTISVSNIAYSPKEFIVTSGEKPLEITLNKASTVLEEVVVKEKKYDKYAINLARSALQKTKRNTRKDFFGKAFYRQKSKNDSSYVELMEIFYDVRFNGNGVVDWEVQEGRYAEDKRNLLNRNFTLLSRIFSVMQPATNDINLPLRENMTEIYDIFLEDIIENGERRLGIVSFHPQEHVNSPSFSGQLYIDIETYDVFKVVGGFIGYNLPFIQLTDKLGSYKDLNLQFELSFQMDSTANMLLEVIKMDQKFDYYYDGSMKYPVHTESFLTFYDYYEPVGNDKKLGGKLSLKKSSDREILDLVGYNKKFWEENPIVKRTPVEEEVIAAFEEDQAFGTIFLNSFEQIALNETDIRNEPFLQDLLIKTLQYQVRHPVEKVYLHTDRSSYFTGEDIWYSGYIVDANGFFASDISYVLHVDLISPEGKVIESQQLEIHDGVSNGKIGLSPHLPAGKYQLRGYTRWMRNQERAHYFTKELTIYNPKELLGNNKTDSEADSEDELKIQFLPEGGHLVENITSIMAIKAETKSGRIKDVEGTILDENGEITTYFKSTYEGMGTFQFKPVPGKKYMAKVKGEKNFFPLPEPLPSGYVIHIRNNSPKGVKVRLVCTDDLNETPVFLVGTMNGTVYYRQRFDLKNGVVNVEVPKNRLPSGILTLTLINESKRPIAERIVYIDNDTETRFNVSERRFSLGDVDEIYLKVTSHDPEGKPVKTNFSLAVTDRSREVRELEDANILSELFIQSDLTDPIPFPGKYVNDKGRLSQFQLDLIMMTFGWRKFPWQELLFDPAITNFWSPEKGISIKGAASNPATKEPLNNHQVILLSLNKKSSFTILSSTDNFGIFHLEDLDFTIHDRLIFKVLDGKGNVVPANIVWEANKLPVSRFRSQPLSKKSFDRNEMEKVLNYQNSNDSLSADYYLDEVVVRGSRLTAENTQNNSLLINPHVTGRNYTDIFELIATNVPGAQVTGGGMDVKVSLGGSISTPLFVVDGMEMNFRNEENNPTISQLPANQVSQNRGLTNTSLNTPSEIPNRQNVYDLIGWIQPHDVKRLEVLKRFNAASYGPKGIHGVIIIHTSGDFNESGIIDQYAIHIQEKGFEPVRTFYQPSFEPSDDKKKIEYIPSTIYWLPTASTDEKGEAEIIFKVPRNTEVQAIIEGISEEGLPGFKIFNEEDNQGL